MSAEPDTELRPCFERVGDPKWCASLANGHPRCRKGTCWLTEPEPEPG